MNITPALKPYEHLLALNVGETFVFSNDLEKKIAPSDRTAYTKCASALLEFNRQLGSKHFVQRVNPDGRNEILVTRIADNETTIDAPSESHKGAKFFVKRAKKQPDFDVKQYIDAKIEALTGKKPGKTWFLLKATNWTTSAFADRALAEAVGKALKNFEIIEVQEV